MNTKEKYDILLDEIGIMIAHPFQDNYYASFASFADSLPKEILAEAQAKFEKSKLYKELCASREKRLLKEELAKGGQ